MAVQSVTPTQVGSDAVGSWIQSVFQEHADETVTPYRDSRDMAGKYASFLGTIAGVIATGTITTTADAAADGLDVLLPFTPKAVIVHNETLGEVLVKLPTHPTTSALRFTVASPCVSTYAGTRLAFGNDAATVEAAFTVNAGEIDGAAEVLHFIAFG